jgi:excinuclease ABC subunit C
LTADCPNCTPPRRRPPARAREDVEFTALAKREELLYRPGSSEPIVLDRGSESLYLVQRLRDEAHRFAITFHRSKRGKSMVATTLQGIEGLGPGASRRTA